jgi:hypothetical protein
VTNGKPDKCTPITAEADSEKDGIRLSEINRLIGENKIGKRDRIISKFVVGLSTVAGVAIAIKLNPGGGHWLVADGMTGAAAGFVLGGLSEITRLLMPIDKNSEELKQSHSSSIKNTILKGPITSHQCKKKGSIEIENLNERCSLLVRSATCSTQGFEKMSIKEYANLIQLSLTPDSRMESHESENSSFMSDKIIKITGKLEGRTSNTVSQLKQRTAK